MKKHGNAKRSKALAVALLGMSLLLAAPAVATAAPDSGNTAPSVDAPVTPTDPTLSSKTAEPDPDWAPTENPKTTIVQGQMRSDREEIPEPFTKADADKAETMEARLSTARLTAGCQVYWPSPFEVCGAIRDKYNSLGGPGSFLSFPTTAELTNPGNTGKRTQFLNGPIYWSAAGGAHPVVNSFLNRWGVHGYEAGWLGYPTTDEIVHADGVGRRQEFQNGAIYVAFQNAVGSAIKNGPIRDKWNTVGTETAGSLLGYLTGDEIPLPDGQGRMARFERGVIYWHPTLGAQPVVGSILTRWAAMGYEASQLGYPTSGEVVNPDGVGRRQAFQNGAIYWKAPYGAHEAFGPLFTKWQEYGFEAGWLGYPVANIGPSTGDWTTVSQVQAIFENGGLFLDTATGTILEGVRVNTPEE